MIMNDDNSRMLAVHLISAIFQFTLDIHVALLILVHLHSNVFRSLSRQPHVHTNQQRFRVPSDLRY